MPVQVFPARHEANKIQGTTFVETPTEVLQAAWPSSRFNELLQSSFTQEDMSPTMMSSTNGFVHSIVNAYSRHHHLRIRPDDIWFAILTQLSIYINKNAEELRDRFVAHQGQKELVLTYGGNRYTMDFGVFAQQMTKLLEANVVDPELRDWMMPKFTTTTRQDNIVASILMMGSLQKYFSYKCCLMCGIPSVTLLGEREDYVRILLKLDRLSGFGDEAAEFQQLLTPVLSHMIRTFDEPESEDVITFWQRSCQGILAVLGRRTTLAG